MLSTKSTVIFIGIIFKHSSKSAFVSPDTDVTEALLVHSLKSNISHKCPLKIEVRTPSQAFTALVFSGGS